MRVVFANQLRGIAALCVVVTHYLGVFWNNSDIIGQITSTPAQNPPTPTFISALKNVFSLISFNPGAFGVGLFFLISGLVLPFSLAHHTSLTFLAARALRIYPTYFAGFALQLSVIAANAHFWGLPFVHSNKEILANAFLIEDLLYLPVFDTVNWTLLTELKFYVIMALIAPFIRLGSLAALYSVALALTAATMLALSPIIQANAAFLVFMLIGVLFHYRLRNLITAKALIAGIAAFSLMFVICWKYGVYANLFPAITINYFYALIVFSALFVMRDSIRNVAILDRLADISYPLYLIHALIGYSLLKLLMLACGLGFPLALALTLAIVLGLSAGLHKAIEKPTIAAGRYLSSRKKAQETNDPVPRSAE
ncbi:acyltransferase family protein [Methyloferula stellata]|uniref:acyltransferase family protein n=1 Tax=Methyloferula stellata TaxID=876270 RepID=UPI000364A483|nr:acyltransferase [Methyloferula stellata]